MKRSYNTVRRAWCTQTVGLFAVLFVVLSMAACGGQSTPPEAPAAPPRSTAQPPSAPLTQPAPEAAPMDDGAVSDAEGDVSAEAVIDAAPGSDAGRVVGYEDGVVQVQTPQGIQYIVEDPTPGMLEQLERDSAAVQAAGGDVSLPENFPADVPLPGGIELLAAHGDVNGEFLLQASSPQSLADLSTHFQQSMEAEGWQVAHQLQDGGRYEQYQTIVFQKDNRSASVNLVATNRLPYQQITVTLQSE